MHYIPDGSLKTVAVVDWLTYYQNIALDIVRWESN